MEARELFLEDLQAVDELIHKGMIKLLQFFRCALKDNLAVVQGNDAV